MTYTPTGSVRCPKCNESNWGSDLDKHMLLKHPWAGFDALRQVGNYMKVPRSMGMRVPMHKSFNFDRLSPDPIKQRKDDRIGAYADGVEDVQ